MTKRKASCLWDYEDGGLRRESHDYSGDGGSCVNCYEYVPVTEESDQ